MSFCHLHTHTKHSFFDGLDSSEALVEEAVSLGQPGIAITDHGNMYGAAQFFKACQKHGIKGVIGMEIYESVPHTWDLERDKDIMSIPFGEGNRYYHLTLWALNLQGWMNLCTLHTLSYTENFKMKNKNQALIDRASLEKYNEGLMVGLGCMASRTNQLLMMNEMTAAYESAKWYKEVFGDRVVTEIMGNISEQQALIRPQREIAAKVGNQVIATNDVHYRRQEDGAPQAAHHLVVQARYHKKKEAADKSADKSDAGFSGWYGSDEFYMKSEQDMLATGGITAADCAGTVDILDRVEFDFLGMDEPAPPIAPIPEIGADPEFDAFIASGT